MNKVYPDAVRALEGLLFDGMSIMAGGFGQCGIPEHLIGVIKHSGVRDLTVISNNCGSDGSQLQLDTGPIRSGLGLRRLLEDRQIKTMICSFAGDNKELRRQSITGELDLQFVPQGTLAERIRCGGAGIPAFFTKTGVGTIIADGKETREFDGATYVMERALRADLAIVKAWKGDAEGNLVYRKTARNFNPVMATAGTVTVAEVEVLVATGDIVPDHVHTPGIYVDRIVRESAYEKLIEQRTVRARS